MRTASESRYDEFFVRVIERVVGRVQRVVGDRSAAEDVAVEALARAHLRWSRLDGDPHREAWVLRVAIRLAIDHVRAETRRTARENRATGDDRTTRFDQASCERLALVSALRGLPGRQREAIVLRYLADLPEIEVAAAMAVSAGAVKVHVHRGAEDLGRPFSPLDDRGGFRCPCLIRRGTGSSPP